MSRIYNGRVLLHFGITLLIVKMSKVTLGVQPAEKSNTERGHYSFERYFHCSTLRVSFDVPIFV